MTLRVSVGRAPLEREASDHWSLLGACPLGAAALKSLDFVMLRILRGLSQVRSSLTREFPALMQLPRKCESLKKVHGRKAGLHSQEAEGREQRSGTG